MTADDLILTGSSDGLIRLVNIQPHKLVGVLGDHGDFPVKRAHRFFGLSLAFPEPAWDRC